MNWLIWLTAIVWVCLYLFWEPIEGYLQIHIFESVNAFCILSLCYCLHQTKKLFITFFLVCAAMNNLLDELFGRGAKFYTTELLLLIIIPLFWYIKTKRNVREV